MKRILPIILLFALYCGSISAQCDNRSGLIDPSNNQDGNDDTQTTPLLRAFGAPIYSDIVDLKNGSFIGGYLRVANIVSGRTYEITAKKTSNAAPLFITVRRSNGTVVTSGTSPLSISPTFSDSIQVHYSTNSACAVDFSTCRIQMSCTSCSPASSVSNNLCAGAIAIPSGSILNYALTDPVTPSFTLETTSTPQNSSIVYCGSAVDLR